MTRVLSQRSGRATVGSRRLAAAAMATLVAQGVGAQAPQIGFGIQAEATATDNGNGGAPGQEKADLLLSLQPQVTFRREGAGLRLNGRAEVTLVGSARDTRASRALPGGHLDARATLVDRVLFVDAGADVRQTEVDPFGVRAEANSSLNTRTIANYRLGPTLDYEPTSRSALLVRYGVARTRVAGTSEGDVSTNSGLARFALKPQPAGLAVEWARENTDYAADVANGDLRIEHISMIASLALAGEWVLGLSAGSERARGASVSQRDGTYGLRLYWIPGPRTTLAAAVDRRFFGAGWNIAAQHRNPRMSFALKVVREPSSALNGASAESNLTRFLDAILTTRNPDPVERGGVVDALLASRGLHPAIQGPSSTAADYAQLLTAGELTWAFLGPRDTVSMSLYTQSLEQLVASNGTTLSVGAATADSRQKGVSLGWNHRLTPLLSLDTSARWSRIQGLALRAGERTQEASLAAGLVRNLSPRTNLAMGARLRRVSSDALGVNTYDETACFVGMNHRF